MRRFINTLIDLLYPLKCAGCGSLLKEAEKQPFCATCDETLVEVEEPLCTVCGIPSEAREGENFVCLHCSQEMPALDCAKSLFLYGGAIRDALLKLKYGSSPQIAAMLGEAYCKELRFDCDLIIPVPLYRSRIIKRGYNQAVLIAVEVSKALKKPLDRTTLVRVKNTSPQSGLTRKQRHQNMHGAFAALSHEKIKGKRILLVDDVITSGATINECAKVLKSCGAERVEAFAVARRDYI